MLFLLLLSLSVAEVFSIRCYITDTRLPWDSPRLLDCLDPEAEKLIGFPVPSKVESVCYEVEVDGGDLVMKGCSPRGFCPELEDRLRQYFYNVKCTQCPSDGCNRNMQMSSQISVLSSGSEVGGRFLGIILVLAALVLRF